MRFLTVVLAVLLVCGIVAAQQKYLVTSNQEVMPLDKKGETAAKQIVKRLQAERLGPDDPCTNQYTFGYPMDLYPPANNFGAYHKDVLGQWYVAKAAGTIDTVFWFQYLNVGALDSTLTVRINNSIVGPDYGPGVRDPAHGVNFPPPCQNWGYWVNNNDLDQHVAAFPLEATDTTWHSTIAGTTGTRPPFGKDIWAPGGVDTKVHANSTNYLVMAESGFACSLKVGQKFFISMKVNAPAGHVANDTRTEWYAWGGSVTNSDENYPSRNWKFYEHDSGPSNCAGVAINNVKRGWVARGGFADDTLSVAAYNWWYVMTATTNVPPEIFNVDGGSPVNTASTGPQDVAVDIRDCDPTVPVTATGTVAHAWIQWSTAPTAVNGVFTAQPDIPITSTIPPRYEGQIPGQVAGTTISWRVKAIDDKLLVAYGPPHSYKITSLRNQYYFVDTGYVPVFQSIAATGTTIDTGKFFIDDRPANHGTAPKDDGTAGPYDLGGLGMKFFGKDVRYVWVAVNGALALGSDPADTIDIASNGFWTSSWDFPLLQRTGRADTSHPSRLPRNFISPMWGDFIVGDTNDVYGAIRVGAGANAACEYIVEWDSVGDFDAVTSTPFKDIITFRVVLNKCDNSIEYQWENMGTRHKDSLALLGMEGAADSTTMASANPPFVFICNQTYPDLLRPMTGKAMRFIPIGALTSTSGWNLLAVATVPPDYHKGNCFPEAKSTAFAYSGKYNPTDVLTNGPGYWLKYDALTNAMVFGRPIASLPVSVQKGWNMIGTITSPVSTSLVDTAVNTQVISRYFDYSGGYHSQTTLTPGKGYWVKTNLLSGTVGTLTLHPSPAALPKSGQTDEVASLNSITIRDKSGRSQDLYFGSEGLLKSSPASWEMPPAAPDFDARFTSGRLVETYPALIADDAKISFPISVSTDAYPLTVVWNVSKGVVGKKFVLSNGKETLGVLEGSGSLTLKNAVTNLALTLGNGANVPKTFALGQNYPNPFNPTTHFTVDVPKVSDVSVVVYDLLGQKITTLLSGQLSANSYNMTWNGTDDHGSVVPSGVYFVRMVSGDFSAVQKMMLMK